jgi:hypothetical protein
MTSGQDRGLFGHISAEHEAVLRKVPTLSFGHPTHNMLSVISITHPSSFSHPLRRIGNMPVVRASIYIEKR